MAPLFGASLRTLLLLLSSAASLQLSCPTAASAGPILCYSGFRIFLPPAEVLCECLCTLPDGTQTDSSSAGNGGAGRWMMNIVPSESACTQGYCRQTFPLCQSSSTVRSMSITGDVFNQVIAQMPELALDNSSYPAGSVCIHEHMTITPAVISQPDFLPSGFDASFLLGAQLSILDGGSLAVCAGYVQQSAPLGGDAQLMTCTTNLCNSIQPPPPAGHSIPPPSAGPANRHRSGKKANPAAAAVIVVCVSPGQSPPARPLRALHSLRSVIFVFFAAAVAFVRYRRMQQQRSYSSMTGIGMGARLAAGPFGALCFLRDLPLPSAGRPMQSPCSRITRPRSSSSSSSTRLPGGRRRRGSTAHPLAQEGSGSRLWARLRRLWACPAGSSRVRHSSRSTLRRSSSRRAGRSRRTSLRCHRRRHLLRLRRRCRRRVRASRE